MRERTSGDAVLTDPGAPSAPPMPQVAVGRLSRDAPRLILEGGRRYSLGWMDHRTSGPSFVLARLRWTGAIKIRERFPLTEQGWQGAWQALYAADPDTAALTTVELRAREARLKAAADRAAREAESLLHLRLVVFTGGYGGGLPPQGQACDLRFLADRVLVSPLSSNDSLAELAYRDVQDVEVGGPGRVARPAAEVALATVGLGALGAVIGLLIFGRLIGLILGGLLLAFIGALIVNASTRTETTVRIRLADREMYFTDNTRSPEQLRVEMSGVRRAIEAARIGVPGGPVTGSGDAAAGEDGIAGGTVVPGQEDAGDAVAAGSAEATIADQLAKLAGLLQQGLLTREEFDRLKARLIS